MSSGSVLSNVNNYFGIAAGTGYCIRGAGYHIYSGYTVLSSALASANAKIQNTVTSTPYTLTFTSTA